MADLPAGVELRGERDEEILSGDALDFVADLQRTFGGRREELLAARTARQERLLAGELPDFLEETRSVREDDSWRVAEAPPDLQDRRVEITGPTDRKMVINALNSGARVFMADFEDANSPTWSNLVEGQRNMIDAIEQTISLDTGEKSYRLNEQTATLLVRPRGWHLPERHVLVDGEPMSGSPVRLRPVHVPLGAGARSPNGTGPYFYLPKLESHLEARLWNDVFLHAQDAVGIPRGTIRATVLIETILAAFEMEEILYELREHSAGLNAGRWDYIFSVIKKFRHRDDFVLPDRSAGDDDRAVHARVHGAAREDVPRARRVRDGRHGRLHPEPARPGGDRERAREGARGQVARGRRRLRRHLGRASRPRPDRDRGVRPRARRAAEPDLAAAARRVGDRRPAALRAGHARRDHRGRDPPERLGRDPATSPRG